MQTLWGVRRAAVGLPAIWAGIAALMEVKSYLPIPEAVSDGPKPT